MAFLEHLFYLFFFFNYRVRSTEPTNPFIPHEGVGGHNNAGGLLICRPAVPHVLLWGTYGRWHCCCPHSVFPKNDQGSLRRPYHRTPLRRQRGRARHRGSVVEAATCIGRLGFDVPLSFRPESRTWLRGPPRAGIMIRSTSSACHSPGARYTVAFKI